MAVVASRIDSVTVHSSGATVRRRVDLPAGPGEGPLEIEVSGLPLSLVDATVRARLEGPGAERFIASQIRVGLQVQRRDAPPAAPDVEECERLAHALRINAEMRDQLSAEIDALEAVPVPVRPDGQEGRPPPPAPLAGRQRLETELESAVADRIAELRALRDQVRSLEEQAREAEERRVKASSAREVHPDELRKSVHVEIRGEGERPEAMSLVLDYLVPGARWAPAYQIRMSRDCTTADIAMRALVRQRSGEDWTSVKLVLSTAEPLSWTELPELSSLRIGKVQPRPPRRSIRPAPVGAAVLFADYDRDRAKVAPLARLRAAYVPPAFAMPDEPSLHRSVVTERPAALAQEPRSRLPPVDCCDDEDVDAEAPTPTENLVMRSASLEDAASFAPAFSFGPGMAPPRPQAAEVRMAPPRPSPGAVPAMRLAGAAKRGAGDGALRSPPVPGQNALRDEAEETSSFKSPSFFTLALPAADDPNGRTRLRLEEPGERYAADLAGQGLRVSFDVLDPVRRAAHAAAAMDSLPLPPGTVDVRQAAGHFDYAYPCDAPVDVPSDGAFHAVPASSRRANSEVLYVVVPREDTSVFREAELQNPTAAPLLPGPAEIYVAGDYMLGATLPSVAPRGKVKLGLGVEQAIKCARNTRFREERSGDKVVATSELIHDIEIELINHLERAIRCEVRERIPQPAPDAEVVVEELGVEPPWEHYKQTERGTKPLEGGRRWRLSLSAGERALLSARYGVKIYANNEVVAGNRREA